MEATTNDVIQNTRCNVVFESAIDDWTEINSSFDRGILRIAYHGKNRNQTFISKDAFIDATKSLFNCPVVCNYIRETDSIGAHDVEITKKDGNIKMVNITTPVGVVPESAKVWWSEVTEENGDVHEYLCTDILIWKRQEAYEHIKENGIVEESMEIRIIDGNADDDGLYHINRFEFLAFCLLESAPPCFESAAIRLFTLDDFKEQYARMMEDVKREFSTVITASADDTHTQSCSKGGTCDLDVNELMQKYSLSAEDIDFDMTGMQLDEIERKFAEIKDSKDNAAVFEEGDGSEEQGSGDEPDGTEDEPEDASGGSGSDGEEEIDNPEVLDDGGDGGKPRKSKNKDYSLTAGQFYNELYEALSAARYNDPYWGDCCKYCLMDYDPSLMEVYAYDCEDWKLYGIPYSMNGDKVIVDFAKCKRKKTCYVDFDEGDAAFSENNAFGNLIHELRAKFKAINDELDALKEFKRDADAKQRQAEADEVFARFADLNGNDDFNALQSKCLELSIEEIEEKCFAIRGRNVAANFSLDNSHKPIRLPIESQATNNADEPYGGIFVKYGIGK